MTSGGITSSRSLEDRSGVPSGGGVQTLGGTPVNSSSFLLDRLGLRSEGLYVGLWNSSTLSLPEGVRAGPLEEPEEDVRSSLQVSKSLFCPSIGEPFARSCNRGSGCTRDLMVNEPSELGEISHSCACSIQVYDLPVSIISIQGAASELASGPGVGVESEPLYSLCFRPRGIPLANCV